ncbi:MAG: glycerate kinase [Candidatus Deferrimicrobiaceae bacterium]
MKVWARSLLTNLFLDAVASVDPARLVRVALRRDSEGIALSGGGASSIPSWSSVERIFLVGGGKAGRPMAQAAASVLAGKVVAGAIAVPKGEGGAIDAVRLIETGHPLPDEGSREAAQTMLDLVSRAGENDLVIALISGGGSAMISAPPEGVSSSDKEAVFRLLLRSGADITEFNTVRKHLSRVKGGRLAQAAYPARVWALMLSDVPGDDPSVIASGPFSPDPATYGDARKVLVERKLYDAIPGAVRAHIEAGVSGRIPETPKPGDPALERVSLAVIGTNRVAIDAAAETARKEKLGTVHILPGFLRGEARECARAFVEELQRANESVPPTRTVVLIAGGETTVTVRGKGKGGRNQEFVLSAAVEMDGMPGMAVLSCGTDGVDGPTDCAGAFADGTTCSRAAGLGLSPMGHLDRNDAYPFFQALSDLVVTGPTGTNVTDIAIGIAVRT